MRPSRNMLLHLDTRLVFSRVSRSPVFASPPTMATYDQYDAAPRAGRSEEVSTPRFQYGQ